MVHLAARPTLGILRFTGFIGLSVTFLWLPKPVTIGKVSMAWLSPPAPRTFCSLLRYQYILIPGAILLFISLCQDVIVYLPGHNPLCWVLKEEGCFHSTPSSVIEDSDSHSNLRKTLTGLFWDYFYPQTKLQALCLWSIIIPTYNGTLCCISLRAGQEGKGWISGVSDFGLK